MPGNASPPPTRLPAGSTTDWKYGPLADSGFGNPFFYHQFADDFDNALNTGTTLYTVTSSGGGSVAHTAGDGGLALFTTGALANNFESIQLPAASFTLPTTGSAPPGTSTSVKKIFYLVRLQVAHTTDAFIAGLGNTTATPFATGVNNLTDGLFFYKAPTSTTLNLVNIGSAGNSPSGSGYNNTFALTGVTIAANTQIDLGFYVDAYQNIRVFAASQLVGFMLPSGSGSFNAVTGLTNLPQLGPVFANYNFLAQGINPYTASSTNPILFTLANLNLTLAVSNGLTAAATTMTADFHCVQKER